MTGLPELRLPEPAGGWPDWLSQRYERMAAAFGPRHWWPSVTAPAPARAEPFEMITGAILVQNVAWANTEMALLALAQAGLLNLDALHSAPVEVVEQLIRPAGFFRQKARRLKGFAAYVVDRYGGDLAAMLARHEAMTSLRAELLAIPGIGPETADCILCYAAGQPVMAMDAYTRRIFVRMGLFAPTITYAAMQAFFHTYLPEEVGLRGEYHALVDTLGNQICRKSRPRCAICPVVDLCHRVGVQEGG